MATGPVIQTHELTKHYRHPFFTWVVRARALTDLTLQIEAGEVFGLLGPNGSGKSTTIKLILGLLQPTAGEIRVFGKAPSDPSVKSRIGYLPEESYLYASLDAAETLDFYARLFGLDRAHRKTRVEQLLELVGLSHVRGRPVGEFSKGMQRRIGLAQCLINDPELIILDEPTTGLDPIGTAEIKDLVRLLRERGKTVLLCSHLLSEVEDLCDRACILYGGKVRVIGKMSELVEDDQQTELVGAFDKKTLSALEAVIRERQGPDFKFQSGPARRRLEAFFLETVEKARTERAETSGASASGAASKLDFLSNEKPADRLAALLVPETAATSAPKKDLAPALASPAVGASSQNEEGEGAALDALLASPSPSGSENSSSKARPQEASVEPLLAPAAEPTADADEGLLNRLVGGGGEE